MGLEDSGVVHRVETHGPAELAIADVVATLASVDFAHCPLVLSVVSARGFARQIVDVGPGKMHIKVYFVNFSSSVDTQRVWTDCSVHDCRPHRLAGCSLRNFCAMMYAWHVQGLRPDLNSDRGRHVRYKPTPTEVSEYRLKVRLVPL